MHGDSELPWEVPSGPLHHIVQKSRFLQLREVPGGHKFSSGVVGPVPVRRVPRSVFVIPELSFPLRIHFLTKFPPLHPHSWHVFHNG